MCHHYESTPEWEVLVRQALERKGASGRDGRDVAEETDPSESDASREEPVPTPADD